MFAKLLKSSLILALATVGTWTTAIALWRTIGHRPSTAELAAGLVGLPIALGVAVLRWRRKDGDEPEPTGRQPEPAIPALETRRWSILASDVMTPIGHTPADVIRALRQQQRPELDAELRDEKGFPIFAGRVADMNTAMLHTPLLPERETAETSAQDYTRAVAMLSDICRNLAMAATEAVRPDAAFQAVLHLHALLPARWSTEQHNAALDLLRTTAATQWRTDVEATVHTVGDNDERHPLERIDLLPLRIDPLPLDDKAPRPALAMLIGCDSHIAADSIALLEHRKQLLTSRNPQGRIPGEAAAGLLIAAPMHRDHFIQGGGVVMIATTSPDAKVDSDAAINTDTETHSSLPTLLDRLLAATGHDDQSIRTVLSNGNHRGQREPEVLALAAKRLPRLDPTQDCLTPSSGCGHVGAAMFPLALALSSQACLDADGNVLYVSTQTASEPTMLMMEPEPGV